MFKSEKKSNNRNPIIVRGMGKKLEEDEVIPMTKKLKKKCILFLGSRGAGKSTCIQLYLGGNLKEISHKSNFKAYSDIENEDLLCLEVSGGVWEDKEDNMGLQEEFLKFLSNLEVQDLSGVVWCVIPATGEADKRKKERQAAFVGMLGREEAWDRLVVVCKASLKPERDSEEALKLVKTKKGCKITGFMLSEEADSEKEASCRLKEALDSVCGSEGIRLFRSSDNADDEVEDLNLEMPRKAAADTWMCGLPPVVYAKPY